MREWLNKKSAIVEYQVMNARLSEERVFFLILAFVLGLLIGYFVAEWMWQFWHPRGLLLWASPQRDLKYALLAASVSLGFGMLGVALAGFDLLPKGDDAKTREGPPC